LKGCRRAEILSEPRPSACRRWLVVLIIAAGRGRCRAPRLAVISTPWG
jgi:hypothetical protein